MKLIRYTHEPLRSLLSFSLKVCTGAARRVLAKVLAGLHTRRPRGKTIALAGMVVGALMQVVLVLLVWYLVDLCISLMEVWAELAAKHLEITLDRTA
jgi:hypothetical protein